MPETPQARAFGRACRLLQAAEFRWVFDEPHKSADRYFTVLARPGGKGSARLGLVVMKKRIRQAVRRNRVKRLIRESFRHHARQLGDLDVVVLARDNAAQVGNPTLFRSLAHHWRRLARLCVNSSSR